MPASDLQYNTIDEDEFHPALDEFIERKDDILDFTDVSVDFTDIDLPDALNFQPAQWLDDRNDVIRENNTIYEGVVENGRKNGFGTLYDENREQYVRGVFKDNFLVELHFAQFKNHDSQTDVFRFNGLDNLVTSNKHNYVARFRPTTFKIDCTHFSSIHKLIQNKIIIIKILDDNLKSDLENSRKTFFQTLTNKKDTISISLSSQRDIFQLLLIMQDMAIFDYENENENMVVLRKIILGKNSNEVKKQAENVRNTEKIVFLRNKQLPVMRLEEVDFSWKNFLKNLICSSVREFKLALNKYLPSIPNAFNQINELSDEILLSIHISDIELFKDLETTYKQHSRSELGLLNFHDMCKEYVSGLWNLMIVKIKNNKCTEVLIKSEYTNSIFLQVFKTFLELLDVVCKKDNIKVADIIQQNKKFDLIVDKNHFDMCECRIKFLADVLNCYKPGTLKEFKYSFSFFKEKESWTKWIKNIKKHVTNYFDNLSNIQEQYVIWLYYIHNSYSFLLQNGEDNNDLTCFLNSLMNLFKTVIQNAEFSAEKVRILANGLINFAVTISPNFQLELNDTDKILVWIQADYLKDYVTKNEHALDDITDIVDIYQVFWDEKKILFEFNDIYKQLNTWNTFLQDINSFMEFVYNLKIYNNKFLIFLRSVNEFIRLFSGTEFPWYIHKNTYELIYIDNSVDKNKETYVIKDPKTFLKNHDHPAIKHYLILVGIEFLAIAKKFLQSCKWNEKIDACSNLLLLMGRSLIKFNKLTSAVDFDKFFLDFTQPFANVVKNSKDISSFKSKLGSLDNYYQYTSGLNVMGIEKALELCNDFPFRDGNLFFNFNSVRLLDYKFDNEILKSAYETYLDKFNKYVDEYILKNHINKLISHVKSKVKHENIDNWDTEYKTVKLPKILAGLAAVWSALESEDISNKSEGIKPHVIQILCIFRLLGVDQSKEGFDSHLAQVLTGQGKSIVLSLLAATLAITGNRVRIVCYNKYLVKRDAQQFRIFYSKLNIEQEIIYGTFDDMAIEVINPKLKGKSYALGEFVLKMIKNELPVMNTQEESDSLKTVLLIDEVDVFFTPNFYGKTYNPCNTYDCEEMANLQIEIWNETSHVKYQDNSEEKNKEVTEKIQKYINDLLVETNNDVFKNIVRNTRLFFNQELNRMIESAIDVRKSKPGDWISKKFRLHSSGRIISLDNDGKYQWTTYYMYQNAFMYFKLKTTDFDHQNFKNYGYLKLSCGNISYAILPNNYRGILGVTGTLQQLFDFEMRAVKSYGISRASDMPTFFGSRKLRETNFSIIETQDAWITSILDSVSSVINEGRAVIVFFDDEHMINQYRAKFESNLSRYVVLTGNEDEEEVQRMVQEAGVPRRVTIATRGMGRGVDYQSNDSTVEAKGGIHVIQTFFSDDIKEETQIKGRTARKDNNGSYECILCREHLNAAKYNSSCTTYRELNRARKDKAQETGDEIEKKIEESAKKHQDTMDFLKMFYSYNPAKRNALIQRFPLLTINE